MKKVIVTGANGFVGKYLCTELKNNNYHVYAVVRDESADTSLLSQINATIIYCDLSNISQLINLITDRDFECFYHMAWTGSSGEQRKNYNIQLDNAKNCADAANVAALLNCKRFLGAGSVTELMYGDFLRKDGTMPEMTTCYAIGKMAAEYLSKCICAENNVDFLWAYISNFYGIGDTTQNFINYLINNYSNCTTPFLTSGNQRADFMYVSDVARALVAIGEKGLKQCSYYVGFGEPRPLKEYVLDIRNLICPNLESGLGKKEFQGMDIDFESLNINKLYEHTNFKPLVSFREGIKRIIDSRIVR